MDVISLSDLRAKQSQVPVAEKKHLYTHKRLIVCCWSIVCNWTIRWKTSEFEYSPPLNVLVVIKECVKHILFIPMIQEKSHHLNEEKNCRVSSAIVYRFSPKIHVSDV